MKTLFQVNIRGASPLVLSTYFIKEKKYIPIRKRKKEISITQDKMIIAILITYDDSIHDMKIRRNEDAIENFIKSDQYRLYCDRGYIGLEDINALIPKKRYINKILNEDDIIRNRNINRERIEIEHVFKDMKIFKYLRDKYRKFIQDTLDKRFIAIESLNNLKNSF